MKSHQVRAKNLAPDSDNKIHDDEVARRFGFTGALVPGVEVFAYATHPFAEEWGEQFLSRGVIDVRFRRPVYDGDEVVVDAVPDADAADAGVDAGVDERHAVSVTGPDGVVRAVGHAGLAGATPSVHLGRHADTPMAETPPVADARSLAVGTRLGSVHEPVEPAPHNIYLDGVGDSLALYDRFVHPGILLRVVNAVLFRSVAMGPWIHTASACRLLAPAPVPTTLVGHGVVTDRYDKDGRSWVRFDALVLAGDEPVMQVDHLAIYDLGGGG